MTSPLLLAHTLRSVLSPEACESLRELSIARDPGWTTDRETLRQMLIRRGCPVWECALEIEEMAGGCTLWPPAILGPFACLRHFENRPALAPGQQDRRALRGWVYP
jgi:hypothetical protein